ncbi:hypothetical protein AMECASPLE_016761 [Ameca splendens]|uniref:Uncharacterized protein n=1 Tax=Ameca splendens TaxID=208324 RepID=A0ABV0YP79_9TELE
MGPREGAPRMLITPPGIHQALWFIFFWRSIDFLLFSLALIPGSVSSVVLYRGAIIRSLITAPLAAYLLPGDSLFKPPPNDLGKLSCSTSQGCRVSLMSEGAAPKVEAQAPTRQPILMSSSTTTGDQAKSAEPLLTRADFIHIKMSSVA